MNGPDDLRPEIASAQIPSINALVESIHRDEDRSQLVFGDQPPGRILNRRNHSLPLLER
jgi:hypothetical protein